MKNKKLLFLIIAIITTGCSATNKLRIRYDSNPRGASVICDGQNIGYTPHTLALTPTKKEIKSNTAIIPACQLKWASGATVKTNTIIIKDLKTSLKKGRSNLFQRPNVSGYEKDALFALKVESLKAQQAQAAAMKATANAIQAQADAIRQQTYQQKKKKKKKSPAVIAVVSHLVKK